MNRCIKHKSKRTKTTKERYFFSAKDYELLENAIGIVYGSSDNEEKIQSFADKQEKLKELVLKNSELGRECQERNRTLESLRSESKVFLFAI
jgi:hypothetical protein